MINRIIGMFLRRLAGAIRRFARSIYESDHERAFSIWQKVDGDATLRVDYHLRPNSVVFDLGGYRGQWASDIYSRYRSKIYICEIMPEFSEGMRRRFSGNPDIVVLQYGLGARTRRIGISVLGDQTKIANGAEELSGEIRAVSDCWGELGIVAVDLMKINIEGAEYDLLEHLIEENLLVRIRSLQIQFHDDATTWKSRALVIRTALHETHECIWRYPYLWESWELRTAKRKL